MTQEAKQQCRLVIAKTIEDGFDYTPFIREELLVEDTSFMKKLIGECDKPNLHDNFSDILRATPQ